jgi:hypothetical protein
MDIELKVYQHLTTVLPKRRYQSFPTPQMVDLRQPSDYMILAVSTNIFLANFYIVLDDAP